MSDKHPNCVLSRRNKEFAQWFLRLVWHFLIFAGWGVRLFLCETEFAPSMTQTFHYDNQEFDSAAAIAVSV